MDTENIFKTGCLVQLKFSIWGGRVKLPSEVIRVNASPEFIRATKYLVDRDCLRPIEKVRNEARSYIYKKTLPFPISGVLFIPKTIISQVDKRLEEFKAEFLRSVRDFVSNYQVFINQARTDLKDLFDISQYPADIARCFNFEWAFFHITQPGKSLLSPEVYEREQEKFRNTIEEFKESAVDTLKTSFSEMVNRLVDRLSGEKKVFKDTTINNLKEWLDDFESLNITNDQELARLAGQCKRYVTGVRPDAVRDSDFLRKQVADNMAKVKTELDKMLEDRPTRRLRVAS